MRSPDARRPFRNFGPGWPRPRLETEGLKMSVVQSGHQIHDRTCLVAEGTRQTAVAAAGASQSAIRTAEITFHRAVVASALANNLPVPTTALTALRELGVNA